MHVPMHAHTHADYQQNKALLPAMASSLAYTNYAVGGWDLAWLHGSPFCCLGYHNALSRLRCDDSQAMARMLAAPQAARWPPIPAHAQERFPSSFRFMYEAHNPHAGW